MKSEQLDSECQTYCRYLTGQNPTSYIREKYHEYHQMSGAFSSLARFDRFLLSFSRRGTWMARIADGYSVRFLKQSAVRKKLVLMLALLECAPPSSSYLDASRGPAALVLARMCVTAAASLLALVAAVLVLLPVHWAMGGLSLRRPG